MVYKVDKEIQDEEMANQDGHEIGNDGVGKSTGMMETEDINMTVAERSPWEMDSDILLEVVEVSLGKKQNSEMIYFKDNYEEAEKFLVETGEPISPLVAKARLCGYMGNKC